MPAEQLSRDLRYLAYYAQLAILRARVDLKVHSCGVQFSKPGLQRRISPSFLFMRGSEASQAFLDRWSVSMNTSHAADDGALFNKLLHEAEVNKALSIQLLPEVKLAPRQVGNHLPPHCEE